MCKMFKLSKSSYYHCWVGEATQKMVEKPDDILRSSGIFSKDSFESYGHQRIKAGAPQKKDIDDLGALAHLNTIPSIQQ